MRTGRNRGEEISSRIWRMPVRMGSVIWRLGIRGSFPTVMELRAAGIHGSLRITGPREIHINKRDLNLYKGESEEYSSFGDTEGDGSLEGAVYGLFAAEDIVHPDSELGGDGKLTNTGIVYKKDDLTAVAATDQDGNAGYRGAWNHL